MNTSILPVSIKLKSDLCCGTGEANAGVADNMTATDEWGLPTIPGKRLKGLLRKNAQLLISVASTSSNRKRAFNTLFGTTGEGVAKITIPNAEIQGSAGIKARLKKENLRSQGWTLAQVTDAYTSFRSQTAIDEGGIAKSHSLRVIQVVNRRIAVGEPLIFELAISCCGLDADEEKLLQDTVRSLRRIGLNKNRGFGEVVCQYKDFKSCDEQSPSSGGADTSSDKVCVPYTITLEQDVVLSNNSNNSIDYLPGSLIQGVFAGLSSKEPWFYDAVLSPEGTVFSNAYLAKKEDDGLAERFAPARCSMVMEKNAYLSSSPKRFDFADGFERMESAQYQPLQGYYFADVVGDIGVWNTETGLSFHNSRANKEKTELFSLRKISSGQIFAGVLKASKHNIDLLKATLEPTGGKLSIGTAKSAQFGRCQVLVGEPLPPPAKPLIIEDKLVVECVSDVVVFDSYGNCSCNQEDLLGVLIKAVPDLVGASIDVCYLRFTSAGGFNAHWRLPKRQFPCFAKGSVLVLNTKQALELDNDTVWVGYLNTEGFGEVSLGAINGDLRDGRDLVEIDKNTTSKDNPDGGDWLIKEMRFKKYCRIMENDGALAANQRAGKISRSGAMRILSAFQASRLLPGSSLFEQFKGYAKKNYAGDSNEDILCLTELAWEKYAEYLNRVAGGDAEDFSREQSDAIFERYMAGFIKQLKLICLQDSWRQ